MPPGPLQRIHISTVLLWATPLILIGCGGDGGTDIVIPSLTITTTTTGIELDADGYQVAVDGSPPQAIGLNGSVTVDQLPEGLHTLALSGLAPNCVAGDNPRSITITPSGANTATFAVTCTASTGSIVITTVTAGPGSDPDGFFLVLDGNNSSAIGANASISMTGAAPGAHLLGLTGLAANCQVTGDNPRSISVTAGQTTQIPFSVSCAAPVPNSGILAVTTATGGTSQDPDGYSLSLDGGTPQPIALNATLTLPNLRPGQHAVQLLGVATNCNLAGSNPAPVALPAGGTAAVSFGITCAPPPSTSGSLQSTAATSGSSPDDSYTVNIDGGGAQALTANGSITTTGVAPGEHSVLLGDVAPNCTVSGANPRPVSVIAGQTAAVSFVITCVEPPVDAGSIRVTAATSGNLLDTDGYQVSADNGAALELAINGTRTFEGLRPGSHAIRLAGLASNCTVSGENPRTASVTAGQTVTVSFTITCVATGPSVNLRITNLYITQSTQTLAGNVPLVAGRAAFLRVFVVANQTSAAKPSVEITVTSSAGVTRRTIAAPSSATPLSVQEGVLGSSWNLPLEGALIQPGLSISAVVDPQNAIAESSEEDNRFPASGTPLTLNVNSAPAARIRFIPIQQGSAAPGNVTAGNKDQLVEMARRLYPLNTITTELHSVYHVGPNELQADGTGWNQVLSDIEGMRVLEGSEATYFGIAKLDYQFGIVGLGFVGLPSAMGTDASGDVRRVTAHELGHTWNQLHTPCANPPQLDPDYPYGVGIGVYGMDVAAGELKPPSSSDIMGYCPDPWVSDYIYRRIMTYRATSGSAQVAASSRQATVLIWGRIVNGRAVLEPAFQVVTRPVLPSKPGRYSVEGIATDGSSLFRLSFEPAEAADDPKGSRHFAFAVPLDQFASARLGDVRLSGPEGATSALALSTARVRTGATTDSLVARREADGVALSWNAASHPMVIVRDPDTGEVLSFARGGTARVKTNKRRLELVESDGVRSRTKVMTAN
jgi:hypothetical protein